MAAAGPIALAMQAAGGIVNGIETNRAARAQANVDEENARLSILDGEQQALATAKDARMAAGAQLAGLAADGVALGTGTASDLLAESIYQGELEKMNIRTRATRQAANLQQQADDRRKAGRAALIGGIFGAAASAIKGVSDIRAQRTVSQAQQNSRVPRPMIAGVG